MVTNKMFVGVQVQGKMDRVFAKSRGLLVARCILVARGLLVARCLHDARVTIRVQVKRFIVLVNHSTSAASR